MRPIHNLAWSIAIAGSAVTGAQQPTRSTFYLTVGNDTLTVERVERTTGQLHFQLTDLKTRTLSPS